MSEIENPKVGDNYVLPTGEKDAARLEIIHDVYKLAGERAMLLACIPQGGTVADVGCGTGPVTLWLAGQVGSKGRVDAVDVDAAQLAIAKKRITPSASGKENLLGEVNFHAQSVYELDLPRGAYDLVFSRFLLCHLQRPEDALQRMFDILRPGGHLVIVDIDMPSMFTIPPSDIYAEIIDLSMKGGKARGVDYQIGLRLPVMFVEAGFEHVELELAQPIYRTGANKQLWEQTFRNAAPSLIAGGITTQAQVDALFKRMAQFAADETTWIAQVRATVVTGRKPA